MDFNNQISLMQDTRHREEYFRALKWKSNGEDIYLRFCVWCNCYGKEEWKSNAKMFAKYLKDENITLGFWQRKAIAENHFWYVFTYDETKKDWEIKRR